MKIILSPAKQMVCDTDTLPCASAPVYIDKAGIILTTLQTLDDDTLKDMWKCNEKIASENIARIRNIKLDRNLTAAILSYDGIAYKYMAPSVFEDDQLSYINEHLRILSAFYGVLKPLDGITPYRLEMQAKLSINGSSDIYDFWGDLIYKEVSEDGIIINLASKEYSKCVEKYLKDTDRYITVSFVEEAKGKLVTKGTYAKMARGQMVRYMAQNNITEPSEIKKFNQFGYHFREDISTENEYIFERIWDSMIPL